MSLSLQVFLILLAPIRKKIANDRIIFLLWLAYLMADWIAAFGIGLISHNQGNLSTRATEVDGSLQAFWASFLLLHLGGPDTITAFSLEDSSLWRRHLLSLIFQVGAAIYVFGQIFPSNRSLVIPTMLVFLVGVTKNVERIRALNLSSFPKLRESMLSDLRGVGNTMLSHQNSSHGAIIKRLEEFYVSWGGYSNEEETKLEEAKLSESAVVEHAYYFFQIFKVFIGNLIFRQEERKMSCKYFHMVSAVDALRVISVELNFIYEVLYTKALAIHSKWSYVFRFISFTSVLLAFILFNRLKKHGLPELDVKITCSLLFGGIALDVIALFMLVFSDWAVARIECYNTGSSKLVSFLHNLVSTTDGMRKPRFTRREAKHNSDVTYEVFDTPLIFRRWSESISGCNLFSEILKKSPRKMYKPNHHWGITVFCNICNFPSYVAEKVISCLQQAGEKIVEGCGSRERLMIVNTKYKSKNPFPKKLWIFIFEEVKRKSKNLDKPVEVRKIFDARGDLFLQSMGIECKQFLLYVEEANYDASIMMWHLATEAWYNHEKIIGSNDEMEFSKILSDYMMYLFLNQPNVMSAVGGICQMTSAETLRELWSHVNDATKDVEGLCKILSGIFESTSPLCGAGILALKLGSLGEMKWKVISRVWVEMLSYAAGHIKGEAHVQVLSKGGELLTFVWLLMAHFGCLYEPNWGMHYEPLGEWTNWSNF